MSHSKLLIVYPSAYDEQGRLIKAKTQFVASRTLPYLAALTPERFDVRVVDECVSDIDVDCGADLVAITALTRNVPRAIDISREFRKRGTTTILGGVAAFSLKEELQPEFDSLVIGEADELWEGILEDFEGDRLKPLYECTRRPELKGLPFARFDLLDKNRYMQVKNDIITPIESGRGCPNNCSYCLVTKLYGKKMRCRPIGEILAEIKHHGAAMYFFCDDNIAASPGRARELFSSLKPLGIRWSGQFESRIVRSPDLLKLAADAGCTVAFVGVESLDAENLQGLSKRQNANLDVREIASGFKNVGINLFVSMMFGLDNDTRESMMETVEQLMDADGIEGFIPWMAIPLRGTEFHEQSRREGLIIHENHSLYDGWHPVLKPKRMTVAELQEAYWSTLRKFYAIPAIARRVWRSHSKMVSALAGLYFRGHVRRGVHPFSEG